MSLDKIVTRIIPLVLISSLISGSCSTHRGNAIRQGATGLSVEKANEEKCWEQKYESDGVVAGIRSIQETKKGTYIAAGWTATGKLDESGSAWFLELDSQGRVLQENTYRGGRFRTSLASSILETSGGYLVSGWTEEVVQDWRVQEAWAVKLDQKMMIEWEKVYKRDNYVIPPSIQQTKDGGYMLAVLTQSESAQPVASLLKLDPNGNVEWKYRHECEGTSLWAQQTNEEGYIMGCSSTTGGLLVKLTPEGILEWEKKHDVFETNQPIKIVSIKAGQQTKEGRYIITGSGKAEDGDNLIYVLKIDSGGGVEWGKTYRRSIIINSIQTTRDEGYILAGKDYALSPTFIQGIVLKLDPLGEIEWEERQSGEGQSETYTAQQTKEGGYVEAGETTIVGKGSYGWVIKRDEKGIVCRDDKP